MLCPSATVIKRTNFPGDTALVLPWKIHLSRPPVKLRKRKVNKFAHRQYFLVQGFVSKKGQTS